MYFVRIGLLFFLYVRNITFQISHIYSKNKKIRTIPEMRTSGCLFNCYFGNRSLFMADYNDNDYMFVDYNNHYHNFI